MLIVPPNSLNQTPMWNSYPMFSEPPMMPMPNFDTLYDSRQNSIPVPPVSDQDLEPAPIPPVVSNPLYTQGWLTTQIGKIMKVDFLIGSTILQDREGVLTEVGISYIVIRESGTNDTVMCDIYSIKFVRIYQDQTKCRTRDRK